MENIEEIVAAFLDDEVVDPVALKHALATPEGRDALVDLLAIRGLVSERAEAAAVHPGAGVGRPRRYSMLRVAVIVLACSGVAGFVVGERVGRSAIPRVEAARQPPTGDSAPAPTQVIRLQSGVDWTERSGGN